jgi:hypothetical protein
LNSKKEKQGCPHKNQKSTQSNMAPANKKAAAAAKAANSDDEHEVDMTSPVILDPMPDHAQQPLPELPSLPHDGETDDERRARFQQDDDIVARAKKIRDGREVFQAKMAAGSYGGNRRKSHWDYVLIEMRWMASDFAAERDWKLETARQCARMSAACEGVPKVREDVVLVDRKKACAAVAKEIAAFWAKAGAVQVVNLVINCCLKRHPGPYKL